MEPVYELVENITQLRIILESITYTCYFNSSEVNKVLGFDRLSPLAVEIIRLGNLLSTPKTPSA